MTDLVKRLTDGAQWVEANARYHFREHQKHEPLRQSLDAVAAMREAASALSPSTGGNAMTDRCDNCRFWSRRSDERGNRGGGYCRRFPPFAPSAWARFQEKWMPSDEYLNDAWPMTGAQSWCGEYASLQKQESGDDLNAPS